MNIYKKEKDMGILILGVILVILFWVAQGHEWYSEMEGWPVTVILFIAGIVIFIFLILLKEKIIDFKSLDNEENARFYFGKMLDFFRTIFTATVFIIAILWGFRQGSGTPNVTWGYLKFQTIIIVTFVVYITIGTYISIGTELKKKMRKNKN